MGNALSRNAGSTKRLFENERKFMNLKYLKNRVELKLFERKLEFWNLFESWSLKNYWKIGVLEIKFEDDILRIKFGILGFWKIWKMVVLENYLKNWISKN